MEFLAARDSHPPGKNVTGGPPSSHDPGIAAAAFSPGRACIADGTSMSLAWNGKTVSLRAGIG
jgi:hypothetical protein